MGAPTPAPTPEPTPQPTPEWQSLTAANIDPVTCDKYQYKYSRGGITPFYSPETTTKWDFATFQEVTGTWTFDGGSFSCSGGENSNVGGVGCSNGAGAGIKKVLLWDTVDSSSGTGNVCF